jgi:hypothetical protein
VASLEQAALWIAVFSTIFPQAAVHAQERGYSVVLPELQYSRSCVSHISLHNTSPRFVDVEVDGHRSNGALASIEDHKTNRMRLAPSARLELRLNIEADTAWAEIVETVPAPRLHPVLEIRGTTQCLDGNQLLTEAREIAPLVAHPRFSIPPVAGRGGVLLLINASDTRMRWFACYSAGTTVSNGDGEMVPLCSESSDRTLAPYQSSRVPTTVDGNPLVQFHASGTAVAIQLLTPVESKVNLFQVESKITFEPMEAKD